MIKEKIISGILHLSKKILKRYSGKVDCQYVFKEFHKISIEGMNIGTDCDVYKSGEFNSLHFIKDSYKSDEVFTIFDVGANVGKYSQILLSQFSSKVKIYAFEPMSESFKTLSYIQNDSSNFHCFNFGFSNVVSQLPVYFDTETSSSASVYKRKLDHFNVQLSNSDMLQFSTIDAFCTEMNIQKIHFLKLDVEGHELRVLEGAKSLLENNSIDFIQFEFGGCNIDSKTFFQDFYYLLSEKYTIARILKDGLYTIESYSEMTEIFIYSNYLAKRKDL